jgi:hypothetical protein
MRLAFCAPCGSTDDLQHHHWAKGIKINANHESRRTACSGPVEG